MCGRFSLVAPAIEVAKQFNLVEVPLLAPRYNIAPSQPVAIIRENSAGFRELSHAQWGLIPSWAKDSSMASKLINARSETVSEKPAFRAAIKSRRCIVPASGFYEWQSLNGKKQPIYIHPTDGKLFAIAGLWEHWKSPDGEEIESCTLLTAAPNTLISPIHDRMPVLLEPEDYALWLNPKQPKTDLFHHLFRPYPAQKMAVYPVAPLVNNPRYDASDCMQPVAA